MQHISPGSVYYQSTLKKYYYLIIIITSIVPISLKRIELHGAPSTGVGQSHSQGKMQKFINKLSDAVETQER